MKDLRKISIAFAAASAVCTPAAAQEEPFDFRLLLLRAFPLNCLEFPDANGDWMPDCNYRNNNTSQFLIRRAHRYELERKEGTLKFEPARPYQSVWDFTG